jgi:hypothetical protein
MTAFASKPSTTSGTVIATLFNISNIPSIKSTELATAQSHPKKGSHERELSEPPKETNFVNGWKLTATAIPLFTSFLTEPQLLSITTEKRP